MDDVLEWSSKRRVSLSLYVKFIFEIVQGSQRPSDLDNDQATTRKDGNDVNHNLYTILLPLHLAQFSLSYGGSKRKNKRAKKGMDRTHRQLYERHSTAAHARPCVQHTKNWKR